MQLYKWLKYLFLFLNNKRSYFIPGVIFFFILFFISNGLNFDFSYMGNKSDKIFDIIFDRYLLTITFQLLKILVIYIFIGAILYAIVSLAFEEFKKRVFKKRENYNSWFINCAVLFLYVFLLLSRNLIEIPQIYVGNFAQKAKFFKQYQIFLTDNIDPIIFDIFLCVISIGVLILCLLSFNWSNLFSFIRNKIKSSKFLKAKIIIFFLFHCGLLIVFFINNIFPVSKRLDKPNIIIISADALRPDHMSFNGYEKKTSPNIDKLSEESLQIKGVITTLPRTFPSWVSILTSQYPLAHGIKHMFPRTRERNVVFETAAAYLKKQGYNTSVISDFAGDIFPRIDLGFDNVIAPELNFKILVKQIILERQFFLLPFIVNKVGLKVFPELRGLAKLPFPEALTTDTINEIKSSNGEPFFIITFYSITHFPFSSSYPYYKKFTDPDYDGPFKYFKDRIVQLNKETETKQKPLSRQDKAQVSGLYDGCLSQFDKEAGNIIEYLKEKELLDNTIIIITSDHGENLYEKNFGMGHGEHLKGNNSLEVPFIIYSPKEKKLKGKSFNLSSSTIDIMPTVFEMAGFKRPEFFDGISLLDTLNADKNPKKNRLKPGVDAYVETGMWFDNNKSSSLFFHHQRIDYPDFSKASGIDFSYKDEVVIFQKFQNIVDGAKYRAIYSGRYKLIYIPLQNKVKFELYDFINDPDNEIDLSSKRKDILRSMKNIFYDFIFDKSSGNYLVKDRFLFPAFTDPLF